MNNYLKNTGHTQTSLHFSKLSHKINNDLFNKDFLAVEYATCYSQKMILQQILPIGEKFIWKIISQNSWRISVHFCAKVNLIKIALNTFLR